MQGLRKVALRENSFQYAIGDDQGKRKRRIVHLDLIWIQKQSHSRILMSAGAVGPLVCAASSTGKEQAGDFGNPASLRSPRSPMMEFHI